jgi:hypothetical protein
VKYDERERFREALLSGAEPSGALKERFERQVESLLRPKLSGKEAIVRKIIGGIYACTAAFFAFAVYLVVFRGEGLPKLVRLFMGVCFSAGSINFIAASVYCMSELWTGRVAPRRRQKLAVFIPYGYVLALGIFVLMLWPKLGLPLVPTLWSGIWILFFWVMAVGGVLFYSARWHSEDILLEQKRTQLEVALLREELGMRGAAEAKEG